MATLQVGNTSTEDTHNHDPVLYPFVSNLPFEISSRAGSTAFQLTCASLDVTWDVDNSKFPPFLVAIKIRVTEIHCYDRTTGIIDFNEKELFGDYHIITKTDTVTAKADRINDRAMQNACTLYRAIHTALTGDIKTQMFSQIANFPIVDDGVSLFFHMNKLTAS